MLGYPGIQPCPNPNPTPKPPRPPGQHMANTWLTQSHARRKTKEKFCLQTHGQRMANTKPRQAKNEGKVLPPNTWPTHGQHKANTPVPPVYPVPPEPRSHTHPRVACDGFILVPGYPRIFQNIPKYFQNIPKYRRTKA